MVICILPSEAASIEMVIRYVFLVVKAGTFRMNKCGPSIL